MALILGVTGSFGSGKTTVARMFKSLGARCIDADRIYHCLLKGRGALYRRIVSTFGRQILDRNKQIDRRKLARIVFAHQKARQRLCAITHPAIIAQIKRRVSRWQRGKEKKNIVIDAPLLIETELHTLVDKLIVVKINKRKQLARCQKRWGLSEEEITRRINAQLPLTAKAKLADYVVDNNGTFAQTRKQVQDIWKELTRRN